MKRIYIYPPLRKQEQVDAILPRLAWYFRPHLDQIEAVHFTGTRALLDQITLPATIDPAVTRALPGLIRKIRMLSPVDFDKRMAAIDPETDILLLWDERAEAGASPAFKAAIKALTPRQGFYRVDPERTRMEGSFYLWAGLNRFVDVPALTARMHDRLRAMLAEIGRHPKAYVFGTGPSLSGFVESHDFSDGIAIAANSIVRNPEIVARIRPRIIAAADPLYHAGVSTYAGAFRAELVAAMRASGAWFVCPLRDFPIYDAFLPADLRPRIIGIPFDKDAAPPVDLAETFRLHPYPNVLTLALLPLASSLADRIDIVGCDGRRYTDDGFFWSHDQKVQFTDKMAEIQAAHPAFFAIDYNDYYTEHARDVEEVAQALEAAGKTLVTATPSFIPALHAREPQAAAPRAETRTFVMIDPDAKDDWGHFLAYDKRVFEGVAANGLSMALLCRADLDARYHPPEIDLTVPVFSVHSWSVGRAKGPPARKDLLTFARELEAGLDAVEARFPEGEIVVFMYIGTVEFAEIAEHVIGGRPRLRAVVNLFWTYDRDETDLAWKARWAPMLARMARGAARVSAMHSAPQIAADYRAALGLDLPVLPHPSTTFGDAEAAVRAAASPRPATAPFRILFPGGARREKGFVLSVEACAALARDPDARPALRVRLDSVSGPELKAAYAALDRTGIDILDDDLSDAEFVAMIEAADIVVLPYHAEAFRRRTSGILIDSILLGKPVVVLEGTWLADMVAATRTGEIAAATSEGIVAAVRRIMLDHAAYAPGIARAAADYVAHEGWASLVARVLSVAGARVPQRPADPAKAVEDRRRHVLRTLVSSVPTRAPIYLPTEKVPLADQVAGMARVKRIYDATLDAVHRPRLRALRETWRGTKRCFVIGNGPSLNRTDLSKLEGEVTFAVNGFFLKMPELGWHPTFYVVEDHLVAEDRAPWINRLKGPTKLFPAYLGYAFPEADDTIFFNHRPRKSYPHGFDFSLDAAEVTYTGCTVTFTVLQLAAYLGFEEIYLVGVDADYAIPPDAQQASAYSTGVIDMQSDDTNHFHPDYFGKGFRWHDPQVDKMVEAYAEARRTIETTDQRIYNATVGGKLEVFERRDFESLFPKPPAPALPRPAAAYPRLLVLDMTVPGRGTATGEIKSSLMADWPTDRVLQIAARPDPAVFMKAERAPDGGWAVSQLDDAAAAAAAARRFAPDAILYRPLPDVPHLHGLAMEILTGGMTPFAIWVMDDWLARLAAEEPARHPAMKADMERLAADATVRLAISDAMARALEAEYAVAFATLANGVDPADWTRPHRHRPGPMLVRYAGGLEETMTRASVLRIARAVEALARSDVPVRFEITTRIKVPEIIDAFRPFRHTRVEYASRPSAEYFAWLAGADVTLIAYNFDPVSTTYVRHSMANKMPECLASGSVLLAHGPEGLATLDYLAAHEAAVVVTRDSDAAVTEALRRLQADPARRAQIAARGRLLAFARHDLRAQRETFRLYMTEVARGAGTSAAPAAAAERDAALRELAQLRAHFEALHAAATAQAMQDGPGEGSDTRATAARIEALEAENERLYAALQQALRQARWAPRRDGTAG